MELMEKIKGKLSAIKKKPVQDDVVEDNVANLKAKVADLQAQCADCCNEYALRTGSGFKEYERRREELNEAQRNLDALLERNSKEKQ